MLEICASGFLITSFAVSVLLWRALVVAKRADYRLQGLNDPYLTKPIPSGDD